jgi:hypothetical protein
MPNYLVESYLPRGRAQELPRAVERARAAAELLAARGALVRHLRSTFLPEDELCLHLFDADSVALVREASRRAGITAERVVEAVPVEIVQ